MGMAQVIAAFGEDHTIRLTGITKSQLRYWDRIGFYRPSFAEENRRVAFSRVYSFKDIVALRVLNILRNQYSVPLQHLRAVSKRLGHLGKAKWTVIRLWVLNRKVVWEEPDTGIPQEVLSRQFVVPTVIVEAVASETLSAVEQLNIRDESKQGKIERSRFVNRNAPVLAGTRIPVAAIKSFAAAGYGINEILAEYPDLTEKDVQAALNFALAA